MTKSRKPVLIGIDIGTTSVKAVMSDVGGQVLDRFHAAHDMHRHSHAVAEQDAEDWWTAVQQALDRFAAHPRARDVAVLGVTGQVNTHLFCDANLMPLRPAITWQDGRAATVAARLDTAIGDDAKIAALGAPIPIDASHALSRLAWLTRHEPEIAARACHLLLPKDWIIARLTGHVGADPLSSVGLVGPSLDYASAILDLVRGAANVLPPLFDPLVGAGNVRRGPFAGVPVIRGTMDAWASLFGLGLARDGEGMYLSGTSDVLAVISSTGRGAPGVVTFPPWRGIALHAGPTQSGGASITWAAGMLGRSISDLSNLANQAPIRPDSPLFLPHLEGERAPLWDAASRGGFAGLSSKHGPADMAAAVMEGVAFAARHALEAVEDSAGVQASMLRFGGGGAASSVWTQIRADSLGRTLIPVQTKEPGALGALVIAGVGAEVLDSLDTATDRIVSTGSPVAPRGEAAEIATARFRAWRKLHPALRSVTDLLR